MALTCYIIRGNKSVVFTLGNDKQTLKMLEGAHDIFIFIIHFSLYVKHSWGDESCVLEIKQSEKKLSVEIFERISNIIKHLNIFTAVIKNIRGKN